MRAEKAIDELEKLKQEAGTADVRSRPECLTAWTGKVRAVLVASLGKEDHLVSRFDGVKYTLGAVSSYTTSSEYTAARHQGIRNGCGVIEAALYQLRLRVSDDEPVDLRSFDPELWQHVRQLVEDGDWGKVASQTAIFVEDRIRTWAGDPKSLKGESMIGKALMGRVLANESDWRLGAREGEREGWRALGTGFAQALSNVDRHRIQSRNDAQRYAIGVLGLGSLLLTQLRHEHGELIEDIQTGADDEGGAINGALVPQTLDIE